MTEDLHREGFDHQQLNAETYESMPKHLRKEIHRAAIKHMFEETAEWVKANSEDGCGSTALQNCMQKLRVSKCCTKAYHYGITLTRNPNIEDVKQFVVKAMKMLARKWFKEAELQWAFEAFSDGKPINEHIHVYAVSKKPLHMNDVKKCYPKNRIDMQKLVGVKIPKTQNYIKKDIECDKTIEHYEKHGLERHHSL